MTAYTDYTEQRRLDDWLERMVVYVALRRFFYEWRKLLWLARPDLTNPPRL